MIKGIKVFLVVMAIAIAVTATADEKKIDTANIGTDLTSRVENNVVPPVVKEKYEYYEVCGICEKDVQCDLKKKCIRWSDGKKYDSVTNWKIKWNYGHNNTPQTCTTDSFLVTVKIVYQLPKWVTSGDAPRPLVEKWESFLKQLMIHEKGHRDRAVEAATELTNTIKELPPARTCAELDREVQMLSRKSMIKLKKDQEEYDAVTNHGQTQGAVFP